jgi:hypothetical protein
MNLASSIFNLSGSSLPLVRGSNSMYSDSVQGLDGSTLMSRILCSNSSSRTTAKLVQSDEVGQYLHQKTRSRSILPSYNWLCLGRVQP